MTSKCKTIKCRTPQYTRLYAYVSAVLLTEGGVPIPPLLEIMTEYAQGIFIFFIYCFTITIFFFWFDDADPPLVSNWFEMRSSGTDYYSSVNSISVFSTVPLSFLVSDNCIRLCNAVSNNVSLFSGLSKSMADGFSANHSIVRPSNHILVDPNHSNRIFVSTFTEIMVIKNGNVSTIVGTDHAGYGEGVGSAAKLYCPTGMALTSDSKSLIVCDKLNNLIRMVNLSSRQTSSLAGDRNPENRNGRGSESAISNPAHCVWNRLTTKPQTELFITSMDSIRILNVTTSMFMSKNVFFFRSFWFLIRRTYHSQNLCKTRSVRNRSNAIRSLGRDMFRLELYLFGRSIKREFCSNNRFGVR